MAKNETVESNEEGATVISRAVNKLRAMVKATHNIGEAALSIKLMECAAAIEKLSAGEKGASLEAALRRNRGSDFEVGGKVKVKEQFRPLYGKSATPHEITEVQTIGGDDNKRGGRSFLKVKTAAGTTIVAPASCFEPA